ncbi:hypothetical protein CFP56_034321 [Quercus suber]|uniref:Uncharacterized protein n=1 Tax=Quercus suber TaxID=58331 RepID=A0AAW0JDK7_QUESU
MVGRISLNTILSVMVILPSDMKEIQAFMFLYLIRLPLRFNIHPGKTINWKIIR